MAEQRGAVTSRRDQCVVVGYDGSPDADKALEWAARLVRRTGSTLRLVTVVQWPSIGGVPITWGRTSPIDVARERAAAAVSKVAGDIGEVQIRALLGHPASALVHECDGAELLVVGRRGTSKTERLTVGSVSDAALRAAPCTVCVVPVRD